MIVKSSGFFCVSERIKEKLAARYPQYKISEFVKGGGENLVIPLLAERYDFA